MRSVHRVRSNAQGPWLFWGLTADVELDLADGHVGAVAAGRDGRVGDREVEARVAARGLAGRGARDVSAKAGADGRQRGVALRARAPGEGPQVAQRAPATCRGDAGASKWWASISSDPRVKDAPPPRCFEPCSPLEQLRGLGLLLRPRVRPCERHAYRHRRPGRKVSGRGVSTARSAIERESCAAHCCAVWLWWPMRSHAHADSPGVAAAASSKSAMNDSIIALPVRVRLRNRARSWAAVRLEHCCELVRGGARCAGRRVNASGTVPAR